MAYFDYHAVARRLIRTGKIKKKEYVGVWNDISPALVLFFDNHIPMPIRKERWGEYEAILTECGY